MRVGTFNLMHGRSLVDGRVDVDRVREAVAGLDADVLSLQEVDRAQPRSENADLALIAAEALGATYHRFVPAVIGTPGVSFRPATDEGGVVVEPEYGIALISRYPVREWRVTRLPGSPIRSPILVPGSKGFRAMLIDDEPRVVVAAIVETPAGPMTFAATHLSFVPGWNVRQLRRVVGALRLMPGPRLLLGDLNLPARIAGLASGWRVLAKAPTYPSPSPRVQFDHVLLDPRGASDLRVSAVSTPATLISDHRPVLVDLENR